MPEPLKPIIAKPLPVQNLKSGEAHMAYGCLMMFGGLAALGAVIYIFRDFFFNNVLYTVIGLSVLSALIRMVMYKWKGK